MPVSPALANNIALVKNYVDDPANTYAVFRQSSLTTDLETPFVEFLGAKTMSYPVMPFSAEALDDYSPTEGFTRKNATLERREISLTQDKGYQIGIDNQDLVNSHTTAVSYYNNNVRQKDVPSIDKYRLNAIATADGVTSVTAACTKENVFEKYDEAVKTLFDNEVPLEGTVMYVKIDVYNMFKQNPTYRRIVMNHDKDIDRTLEYLDGVTKIIPVPVSRMPATTDFILVQPRALICGTKYSIAKFITDPEDFDGVLINRRIVHDCFVQQDRAKGVYVQKNA